MPIVGYKDLGDGTEAIKVDLSEEDIAAIAVALGGGLTDEELRASPVPVEGTITIGSVTAAPLTKGNTVAEDVTCTVALTDYAMAAAIAAGTDYLVVYCASVCKVAMGAAVSATNGVMVAAGVPTAFPVVVTGTEADDKAHVWSPTAGAVVTFTSMSNG